MPLRQAELLHVEPQRTEEAGGGLQRTVLRLSFPLRTHLMEGAAKVGK